MARRRFTVRDIAEILEQWQAGRSMKAISGSLVFFQDQLSCAIDIVEKVHIEPPSAGSGG